MGIVLLPPVFLAVRQKVRIFCQTFHSEPQVHGSQFCSQPVFFSSQKLRWRLSCRTALTAAACKIAFFPLTIMKLQIKFIFKSCFWLQTQGSHVPSLPSSLTARVYFSNWEASKFVSAAPQRELASRQGWQRSMLLRCHLSSAFGN